MLTNLPKHNQQVVGHACKLTSPRHSQSNESNTTTQSRGRRQFITKKRYTPHTQWYTNPHTHTHTCRSKATWLIWYNQLCFKSFSLGRKMKSNQQTDRLTDKQTEIPILTYDRTQCFQRMCIGRIYASVHRYFPKKCLIFWENRRSNLLLIRYDFKIPSIWLVYL